ncbi:MAG: rhamnulokinase [Clostridia bacterium]|nr:rhamnulokinase [Clostridia bacterium]
MKVVLAFDFGASSGRAMLGRYEDGRLTMEEIHRFDNVTVSVLGTMHWDVLRLWHEIKQAFYKLRQTGVKIDAVGIDTWGVDFALIDKNGEMLGNAVHYRDERTVGVQERVYGQVPCAEIYRRTGIQTMRINTLYQLYYLAKERPEMLAASDKLLMIADLFAYFLTGAKRVERTNASTTNFLDPVTREWDTELLLRLGIPTHMLPELIESGEVYGTLLPEFAKEMGQDEVPVIAVCTHDTGSAVAAAPAEGDFAYISCGTWSLFGTELSAPLINDETERVQYTNEGGFGGSIRLLKNIMGLWLIQEARREWIRQGQSPSYADLEREALAAEPFRAWIDVDAPEFELAGDMPARVQAFCRATGQYVPQTRGEIMRCIYQSLAMKYRLNYDNLCSLTGVKYPCIHMLGGGIKDTLLCRMTADATGATVVAGPAEATVMGNIAVQMIALGELEGLREARRAVAASTELKTYAPTEHDAWEAQLPVYTAYLGKSAQE